VRQLGAKTVFAKAGVKVDEITGSWNVATIKSQMLSYLSTHPGTVSGVWDGGVCAVPVGQAFKQSGRDLPVITGFEGPCRWLAYLKETDTKSFGFSAGAGQGVQEAFKVAMRLLAGQKPIVNTLLYPLAKIDATNFNQYYNPKMTLNSACSSQPVDGQSVPDSYYDVLFKGGSKATPLQSVLLSLPIS
jgi:ABC-type sugar transport system substrate-binding protein